MAKQQKRRKVYQSTQRLLPIREIRDGIIITNDNRHIKVLEVMPINFLLMSSTEQSNIIASFRDIFKVGPSRLQFKSISKKSNMDKHLRTLREEAMQEESDKCFEMQMEYAKLLKDAGNNYGVSRRFFIAFEYEHEGNIFAKATEGEILYQLETVTSRIVSVLSACGNEVIELSDRDDQILEILYTILNRRKSDTLSFEDWGDMVMRKYLKASRIKEDDWARVLPYIPATEYIAPARIDFCAKDYMIIDDKYYTYAYIPDDGYNSAVYAGWTAIMINAGEGIDVDFFFERVPRDKIVFKIRQSINQNRASIADTADTQDSYDALAESINAGVYLNRGLSRGEEFFYMSTMITISADSLKELNYKYEQLYKLLKLSDIRIRRCKYEIEQAFLSTLPLCSLDRNLVNKTKRNVLSEGASSCYPFTSFELCDDDGILLGENMKNSSLALMNIFDTRKYSSASIFIAGMTGAGKTYTLLLLAIRMRLKHIPVILIAPEKEHEFMRVTSAIGGQFIRFGSGSPQRINILDIFKTDDTAARILDGSDIVSSKLEEKVQSVKTAFKLLIPDITYEEKELLDEALMETYRKKGITRDNESLIDPEDPANYREMPILADLLEELIKEPRAQRISTIIRMLVSGSGSAFNGHTNVNLDNKFVVLGLEHLNADLLPFGMYVAMDYSWAKIKEDRTKRTALFMDEWWRFAFDPTAADYSLQIAKTIRAYGGSLVLATQQMTDIFAVENGKYGEGVLNNCKIKIIMHLEEMDAQGVQKILRLTNAEKTDITRYKKGEALLVVNQNHVPIRFRSNKTEHDLITTDRSELNKKVQAVLSAEELKRKQAEKEQELDTVLQLEEYDTAFQLSFDDEDDYESLSAEDNDIPLVFELIDEEKTDN